MSEPKNKKALETGSGIAWSEWLRFLDKYKQLDHTEMAKVALEKILEVGKSKSPEWWAQVITLAYEQYIGRRKVGQQHDGKFSVTVSKTVDGAMDEALRKWISHTSNATSFNNVAIKGEPRVSQTDKWRYWRCDLENGSKVAVNIQEKPGGQKSILAINHDQLSQAKDVEVWRAFWKSFIYK